MRDRPDDAHRDALAKKLGRPLAPTEVTDHLDEDKSNNAPANLRPMDRGDHTAHHNRTRGLGKLRKALTMSKRGEKLY